MSRRVVAAVAALVLGLALTACGETFEERVANREMCEIAGGVYTEHTDLKDAYRDWSCDLSTPGEAG